MVGFNKECLHEGLGVGFIINIFRAAQSETQVEVEITKHPTIYIMSFKFNFISICFIYYGVVISLQLFFAANPAEMLP